MVGALGDAEGLAGGRLIDLVDTKLKELLGGGVVHDILAAIVDLGVDDGNEESTLGGTLEKDEALRHTRLEKDDGVLELMEYYVECKKEQARELVRCNCNCPIGRN